MNWEEYWDQTAKATDVLSQVGRLNSKQANAVKHAATHISALLDLTAQDRILDVCCGNGLITGFLAEQGFNLTGVDLSKNLINQARQQFKNVHFEQQDGLKLNLNVRFNKIYLAFAFQYFDSYEKGRGVIQKMVEHAAPGALILLTDVPDKAKWGAFYDTPLKKIYYFKQKITKTNTMGKFWSEQELLSICNSLGVEGKLIQQPIEQPYSYYRFDFMIRISQ